MLEVDHGTNLNIDLLTLISEYLVEIAIRGQIYSVVGIGDLLANLRANNNLLTEVDLLSLLTSGNLDLEASLRQSLFFGLLLPMGLTVIFEDGFLIAPTLQDQYSHTIVGSATFMRRIDDQIPDHSPNVASFCEWIGNLPRGYRIHTLIAFIHDQLTQLRESEVSELARFRLKSYSSIINKLFYRGKSLKDLFAITVQSQTEADVIKGALENDYGYLSKTYRDYTNNNGCLTYRYIRILILTIENETIHFPVYYEIVVDNLVTPRSHKIYELDRLRCELAPGQIAILARTSFDLYRVLSPTLTDSEKWVKELRYLAKEYQITDTCRLIPLLSQETTPAIGSPDRVEMMNVFLKYVKLEENSSVER